MVSVGFIGLGNVGGKLAGSLLRNGIDLTVRDLDRDAAQPFLDGGAGWGESPKAMAEACDEVWLAVAGYPTRVKPNEHTF